MEALTLSSPMVIIVVGLPGSGKSFFSVQFANTFGAALVSQDKIRWTLFANQTYSDNENAMVGQVANLLITELFRTKKTFVLDGGYNDPNVRHEFIARARRHGYRALTIVVQTDEPTSLRRATKRSDNKPGDMYKQSLTPEQFEQAKAAYLEPNTTADDVVVISGKHTYTTQAKIVLRKMIEISGASKPASSTNRTVKAERGAEPTRPATTPTDKPAINKVTVTPPTTKPAGEQRALNLMPRGPFAK